MLNLLKSLGVPIYLIYRGIDSLVFKSIENTCQYFVLPPNEGPLNSIWNLKASLEGRGLCWDAAYSISWYATPVALMLPVTLAHYCKNQYSAKQYHNYVNKNDPDLRKLTLNQRKAFHVGAQSAQSSYNRMISFLNFSTWKHGNAYYAGYEAQYQHDENLIRKVPKG